MTSAAIAYAGLYPYENSSLSFEKTDERTHDSDVASLDAEGSGSLVSGESGAVGSVEKGSVVGQANKKEELLLVSKSSFN